MIRKASHIILSIIILLTTAGLAITEHYCGNRLVSVNVLSEPDKCCDDIDCCHNETIIVKLDTDIINISTDQLPEIIYSSVSLVPVTVSNDNSLLSRYLASNILGYSDLPPPAINAFLSKLGTFLL